MNVIFIVDGKPDSSRYYTERFGVDCCVIEMRSELTNKVHTVVDDCIVKKVLKDGTADIGEKYLKAIAECALDYTNKIMRKLREYGYNEELAKLHFLGGGAMLMKHFAKLDQNRIHFIEDIHVNAKGNEYLSHQKPLRSIRRGLGGFFMKKGQTIKNIMRVSCRFDMDVPEERRAWQILQSNYREPPDGKKQEHKKTKK